MKKLGLLLVASTMLLTGCMYNTSQGGAESLTNKVAISEYQISDNVKSQIEKGEQVIITELVTSEDLIKSYGETAQLTASFINSANEKMKKQGYKLISTDTNGMGDRGEIVFVTLVFEKEK